jgi:hypothetical protein
MVTRMNGFPTLEEVEKANREQLARWYRFLPSGETAADQKIMKKISERFEKLGGINPELSRTRPCKAVQGSAFNGSNPTLSAIPKEVPFNRTIYIPC